MTHNIQKYFQNDNNYIKINILRYIYKIKMDVTYILNDQLLLSLIIQIAYFNVIIDYSASK